MNRRKFLKCAFAVAAAVIVTPTSILTTGSPLCSVATVSHCGVTFEQLQELIAVTLRDLPKGLFERAFDQPTWQLTDIYRSR